MRHDQKKIPKLNRNNHLNKSAQQLHHIGDMNFRHQNNIQNIEMIPSTSMMNLSHSPQLTAQQQ